MLCSSLGTHNFGCVELKLPVKVLIVLLRSLEEFLTNKELFEIMTFSKKQKKLSSHLPFKFTFLPKSSSSQFSLFFDP
jgi:hypothetical protein